MGATSVSDFETVVTACSTAIASGDYSTARTKAVQARVLYLAIPEEMRSAEHSVKYRDLGTILTDIDRLEESASRNTKRIGRLRTGFQS